MGLRGDRGGLFSPLNSIRVLLLLRTIKNGLREDYINKSYNNGLHIALAENLTFVN